MTKRKRILKIVHRVGALLLAITLLTMPVFATNYGERASNWILDQIFPIVLIVFVVSLITLFFKRNYTGLAITFIVGILVLFVANNPDNMVNIGENIFKAIFN
ncbi:MAG TPA: hypothetical protein DEQ02_02430 [Ruminococcaceae bacterium]|nr:hypothetical protein [Oscillospiraceae bacterium]